MKFTSGDELFDICTLVCTDEIKKAIKDGGGKELGMLFDLLTKMCTKNGAVFTLALAVAMPLINLGERIHALEMDKSTLEFALQKCNYTVDSTNAPLYSGDK